MKRYFIAAVILVLAVGTTAWAQDYSFSVPRMLLEVTPNSDASVTLDYTIEFQCSPGAHPIDVVDVGLPHKGYNIANMSASANGVQLSGGVSLQLHDAESRFPGHHQQG